jgi:lipid II:glycine glycyltransferase (peptidoglycan interpeptide bridge formation enzyme)
MPKFTQTLGVLLSPSFNGKYEKRLSDEMHILDIFIKNMPKAEYFSMNFHYSFTNWLPFYWAGYKQTTAYTYVIEDLTDLEKIFLNLNYSKKKNIKKAERLVAVRSDLPPKDFYAHHSLTLRKQNKVIGYDYDFFERMYDVAYKHSAGKILYAIDKQKNIHAAIFIVFDEKSAYYLISTIDPDYRDSGAATLLLRDVIVYASQYTKRFDFEGSMIRGVENSFRKFGAIQKSYFTISKNNCFLPVKIILKLRDLNFRIFNRGH